MLVACSGGPDSLALAAGTAFVARGPRGRDCRGARRRSSSTTACRRGRRRWPTTPRRPAEASGSTAVGGPRRGRRTGGPRRPPGTPGTRRWTASPTSSARRSCCSATRSTTRPRPCCWGSRAGRAPGRSRACRATRGRFRRPLLGLRRADTAGGLRGAAACSPGTTRRTTAPHADASLRSRVRDDVLPTLERVLGPGVARGAGPVGRAAARRRGPARRARGRACWPPRATADGLDVDVLANAPPALRTPRAAVGRDRRREPGRSAGPGARPGRRRAGHRLARAGSGRPSRRGRRRAARVAGLPSATAPA